MRSTLSQSLDNLEGLPLKAMVWHLNKVTPQAPFITNRNMKGCTDVAIIQALKGLHLESPEMYKKVINAMKGDL